MFFQLLPVLVLFLLDTVTGKWDYYGELNATATKYANESCANCTERMRLKGIKWFNARDCASAQNWLGWFKSACKAKCEAKELENECVYIKGQAAKNNVTYEECCLTCKINGTDGITVEIDTEKRIEECWSSSNLSSESLVVVTIILLAVKFVYNEEFI